MPLPQRENTMTTAPYQVMPPLAEPEYDALKASIAAGYDPARPIVVDENGAILDGHHRHQVCAELGITPPTVTLPGLTEDQKHDYAMRANLAQRHLNQLQKRELIRAELDRNPDRSDREIGRLCGVDHKTVGAVRRGEIPHPGQGQAITDAEAIAWAEDITAQIREALHRQWEEILACLLAGVPSAEIAGALTIEWYRLAHTERINHDVFTAVHDALLGPRLEALAAWPGGVLADECLSEDDELKAIYTEALAAGELA
jgi:hypothetical protein